MTINFIFVGRTKVNTANGTGQPKKNYWIISFILYSLFDAVVGDVSEQETKKWYVLVLRRIFWCSHSFHVRTVLSVNLTRHISDCYSKVKINSNKLRKTHTKAHNFCSVVNRENRESVCNCFCFLCPDGFTCFLFAQPKMVNCYMFCDYFLHEFSDCCF